MVTSVKFLGSSSGRVFLVIKTNDQLDVVGERWVVRSLKKRGLVKELTNE